MALYVMQDLEARDDGELILDSHGDFKLANPLRTVGQAINTTLLTNRGDLLASPLYGANLITFYGDTNNEQTHAMMEATIKEALRVQGLVDARDIDIDVVPIEANDAAIVVELKGTFADTDATGAILQALPMDSGTLWGYTYPFVSGVLSKLS